jgi:hypothetical protein
MGESGKLHASVGEDTLLFPFRFVTPQHSRITSKHKLALVSEVFFFFSLRRCSFIPPAP